MADHFPIPHFDTFQTSVVEVDMVSMDTINLMQSQTDDRIDQTGRLIGLEVCMSKDELEENYPPQEASAIAETKNLEPCVGLEFESEEAAYSFYNEYARRVGFGVTRRSSRRSRTNRSFIAGQYVCSRYGSKKSNEKTNNSCSILRIGCKAMMKVKKMDSGKWVVLGVIKEHNHELNKDNVCLFRSHKELCPPKRNPMRSRRAYVMERMGVEGSDCCTTMGEESYEEGDEVEKSSLTEKSMVGDTNLEPYVGMEFESEEAAYLFYNRYARRVGFGVTRRSSRRSKTTRSFIAGQYVCSRHRFKRRNEKTNNSRFITWVSCKAMLKVKKMETGKWVIVDVITEHNHEVNPENACFFRSHKQFLSHKMNSIRAKRGSGVQPNKIPTMSGKRSGMSTFTIMEKGCQNHVDKEQRDFFAARDAQVIYEYFMRMQQSNPTFFYAMELDEEQRFKSVFWADAKSRMAYTHFGDVVTFDTGFLTNKYHVPFISFAGVNHHGQSVLFGCALLADETKRSIVWVFKAWLTAMSGRPPIAIITNQDQTIKAAVAEVFPEACHRFQLSDILKKAQEKLAHVCTVHDNFIDEFEECICDSMTVDEFENRWKDLIENFNLMGDEWLQSLYKDRHLWVPRYMKVTFSAGMSTSHGSESGKSFLDSYVNPETTLKEFIEQYDIALQNKREEEAQADFETYYTKPILKTPSPFEAQLASVYTREIFTKFQVEVSGTAACHTVTIHQEGAATSYLSRINRTAACDTVTIHQEGAATSYVVKDLETMKDYPVTWNGSETTVSCICHLFEFRGFLCRHAMTVLIASGVYHIPSHYILKRWTKDATNKHDLDLGNATVQGDGPESTMQRFNDLCQRSIKFAEEGSLSKETYIVALGALHEAFEKVVNKNDSLGRLAQHRVAICNNHYRATEGSEADYMAGIPLVLDPWQTYQLGLGEGN